MVDFMVDVEVRQSFDRALVVYAESWQSSVQSFERSFIESL